jgi:hypothetical protein
VQTLEDLENAIGLPWINADAVVLHREEPLIALPLRRDVHVRRHIIALELDPIGDQVLKNSGQLHLFRSSAITVDSFSWESARSDDVFDVHSLHLQVHP